MTSDQIAIALLVAGAVAAILFTLRKRDYTDLHDHPAEQMRDGLRIGASWVHADASWPEGAHNPWVQWKGEKVEDALRASFGQEERVCIDRSFLTRLVGVKYRNDDGTSRTDAIQRLWPRERLVVRWEEGHPQGEGFGKSILRQNGQQLGWLGRDVAEKIHSDFIEPGHTWMAVFQYPTRRPETYETVGAVILVVRRTPAAGEWFWDLSQSTVVSVDCQTCGAKGGSRCKTKNGGGTYSSHLARVRAFQEMMKQRNNPQP